MWYQEPMPDDKYISSGWHYRYGWLRRPELDDQNGYCYEEADGDLIFTKNIVHSIRVYLDCWRDGETGVKYLTFTRLPVKQWERASK
jgi:hypothetical protein